MHLISKNLGSQDPAKDVIKTEADSSSTAVNTPLTVDPNTDTDTRHEETKVKSSEQNVSSSQEKDSTNIVGSVEKVSDKHENTETSVKPRSMMPPPLPKHKTAPSSSISMLLEGLKESKDKEKFTKPVKRSRKQQTNSNEVKDV